MGLYDEVVSARAPKGPPCEFGLFFRSLSAADQRELRRAVRDRAVTSPAIFTTIKRRGYSGIEWTVGKHRRSPPQCRHCQNDPKGVYAK